MNGRGSSRTAPTGPHHGLITIYTGEGKGKTTAALGAAVRAAGHGLKVIVVQFIKGRPDCGEHLFASRYGAFEIVQLAGSRGGSRTAFTATDNELRRDARQTLEYAREVLTRGEYGLVILDEVLIAIDKGLLDASEVIELLHEKPPLVEVILTGRHAPAEIVKIADLVTEMRMVKHPFTKGIPARRGIEY